MPREMKDSGIEWVGDIPSHWHLIKNKNAFLCKKEIVGEKSSETQLLSLTTRGVRTKSPNAIGGKVPESFDTYQYVEKDDLIRHPKEFCVNSHPIKRSLQSQAELFIPLCLTHSRKTDPLCAPQA